jgi:hypothetical protein
VSAFAELDAFVAANFDKIVQRRVILGGTAVVTVHTDGTSRIWHRADTTPLRTVAS